MQVKFVLNEMMRHNPDPLNSAPNKLSAVEVAAKKGPAFAGVVMILLRSHKDKDIALARLMKRGNVEDGMVRK